MENSVQTSSPVPTKKTYDFFEALPHVLRGKRITKLEWENQNIYGFMNENLLSLHKADGKNYQWIINDGDMAGEDWIVLN